MCSILFLLSWQKKKKKINSFFNNGNYGTRLTGRSRRKFITCFRSMDLRINVTDKWRIHFIRLRSWNTLEINEHGVIFNCGEEGP